jgi:S-disulfanyl-L-cysteine oxidoreductase SoxD
VSAAPGAGVRRLSALLLGLVVAGAPAQPPAAELSVGEGVYSAAQAEAGRAVYAAKCSLCHRDSLVGGVNESPPLKGGRFLANWAGQPLRALYGRILSTMPQADPGSLTEDETLLLVTYLLRENGYPPAADHTLTVAELAAIPLVSAR